MRYYFTDFFHWEQPLINQLRKEGKFVYSVIDTGGVHYKIVRRGIVNRFGFLVTDVDILKDCDELDDEEFVALGGEEDECVATPLQDVSAECAAKRVEYERSKRYDRRCL